MITRLNVTSVYVLDKEEALDFYVGKLGLVVLRAADELEEQRGVLARDADGEPAHEAQVEVVAHLEAEVAGVEVERLVLVEDRHAADVEAGDVVGVHGGRR